MNTGHIPSTMLASPRFRLTSQVAIASPEIAASATRAVVRSNIRAPRLSNRQLPVAGFDQQHLHVADRALHESAFAIAEVVFPHANEFLAVPERAHLREIRAQVVTPV